MSTSTQVEILLFAGAREMLGVDRVSLPISLPCTIAELKTALLETHSELGPFLHHGRIAIDREFVNDNYCLIANEKPNAIALIPPVSGG
jgi:molybdopterin converting factor small subunit